jgi:hypothetical protein
MGKGQKALFLVAGRMRRATFFLKFYPFPASKFLIESGRFLPRHCLQSRQDLGTKSTPIALVQMCRGQRLWHNFSPKNWPALCLTQQKKINSNCAAIYPPSRALSQGLKMGLPD